MRTRGPPASSRSLPLPQRKAPISKATVGSAGRAVRAGAAHSEVCPHFQKLPTRSGGPAKHTAQVSPLLTREVADSSTPQRRAQSGAEKLRAPPLGTAMASVSYDTDGEQEAEAEGCAAYSRKGWCSCSRGTAKRGRKPVIYKLTCTVNGKGYVGQTGWFKQRMYAHSKEGSRCKALAAAVAKHGWKTFKREILVRCKDCELDGWEARMIVEHNTLTPHGYNIMPGGHSNPFLLPHIRERVAAMHASGEIKAAQRAGWAKPGVKERASKSHVQRCKEDGGRQARQGTANLQAGNATVASNTAEAKAKRAATWETKRDGKKPKGYSSYARQCELAGGADKLREKRQEWARLRKERTFFANS